MPSHSSCSLVSWLACAVGLLASCAGGVTGPLPERVERAESPRVESPPAPGPAPDLDSTADADAAAETDAGLDSDGASVPSLDAGPAHSARTDLPAIGPTLPAATTTDTDADTAWNSFLSNHPRTECSIDTPLSWLHDRCRPVRPRRVSTSAPDVSTLVNAFDLDACTIFSAGDAPQLVELEFAREETLDLIVIDPGPRSSGPSRHVIEAQDRRGRWVVRTALFGGYYDTVLYALRFPEPITTRRLRIRTISSPGVVEHREIVPVVCEGEVAIHIEGIAPEPPYVPPVIDWHDPRYTHVAGTGRCRRDADCAAQSCCGGRSCGLRRTAPDCDMVGCPQSCGSPLDCGHGACICHDGVCSLATTFAPDDARVTGTPRAQ